LFIRTARQVLLTTDGERLLERAQQALRAARACLTDEEPEPVEEKVACELTIGAPFEPGLGWLVPALMPLGQARPERKLHLHFANGEELPERVLRGAVDCAVSVGRIAMEALRHELLHREMYAFVTTPAVVARQKLARSADAKHHRILDLHPGLPLFDYFLSARPADERWTFGGGEYLGAITAVRQRLLDGAGVAVLPRRSVQNDLATGALIELMPKTVLEHDDISLVWRARHPFEDEIQRLVGELRAFPLTSDTIPPA
jgi:DNA-binding transcriptional LysR family regulator